MSASEEVRIVSETGGAKGSKPQAYDLIPTLPLSLLAEQYGNGAKKYEKVNGKDNWRNGYPWSLSYAALQRHANQFWAGEDFDEEMGVPHLVAVAWHAFALVTFMHDAELREKFDDRQDEWLCQREAA